MSTEIARTRGLLRGMELAPVAFGYLPFTRAQALRRNCLCLKLIAGGRRRVLLSRHLRLPCLLVLWSAAPGSAAAQSISAATVAGTVVSGADGNPLAGALATVTEVQTGLVRMADVGRDGSFAFRFLPPGAYRLLVEQIGYRPALVRRILLSPGGDARVTVSLNPASPPVTDIDTLPDAGGLSGPGPGAGESIGSLAISRLPLDGLGVGELRTLSSQIDPDRRGDAWAVDGIVHEGARHPYRSESAITGLSLARGAFDRVDVLTAPVEIEWREFTGARLNATSASGTRAFEGRSFIDWTGDALASSDFFDPAAVPHRSVRGAVRLSGPIVRDTAYFVVAAEGGNIQQARSRGWEPRATDATLVAVAQDSFGVALDGLLQPWLQKDRQVNGFARLDWQTGARHRASVSANLGRLKRTGSTGEDGGLTTPDASLEGSEVTARATVTSTFSRLFTNELRAGFELSRVTYDAGSLPATYLTSGVGFGTDPLHGGSFERTGFRLEDALHIGARNHGIKLGVTARVANYDETHGFAVAPVFFFSDADTFGGRRGAFAGSPSRAPAARFSLPAIGGFLQDRWSVAPGLELITAVRYDLDVVRADNVLNQAWRDQTGLDNTAIPGSVGKWSSRLGFTWRAGDARWVVRGGAGVYYDATDPASIAELIAEAGGVEVQRGIGALGRWPDSPDLAAAPVVGERLTLLGPEFESPRSTRASLGVGRRIGASGSFTVAVNYSHTDFLLRRHDLNRLPAGTGADQYGRPVYGTLAKEGSVLVPLPGSNRRFAGFELVSALDPDGFRDYWSVTVRLDQPVGRVLRLLADYTYSETMDNWLSGAADGPYGQLSPFPDSLNGRDWADGRSGFDLPHRAAIAAELSPLGRRWFSIAAVYRIQSGRPFTPGFRYGVDANGDGSSSNDPAYVDDALTGVNEILDAWPCLRAQVGQFAARNSCRDPRLETLNLRIALGPFRANLPVEAWVEFLNVTDADFALRDHALLLVDPAVPLSVDPSSGVVTVPFLANPDFGGILARPAPGRAVRLGLRVNY